PYIFQPLLYGEHRRWAITTHNIEGQWLQHQDIDLQPWTLSYNQSIAGSLCSVLRSISRFLVRTPHIVCVDSVDSQHDQSENSDPKRSPLKDISLLLFSVVTLTFFW